MRAKQTEKKNQPANSNTTEATVTQVSEQSSEKEKVSNGERTEDGPDSTGDTLEGNRIDETVTLVNHSKTEPAHADETRTITQPLSAVEASIMQPLPTPPSQPIRTR